MPRPPPLRSFPNILITGTPGTGKTTLASALFSRFGDAVISGAVDAIAARGIVVAGEVDAHLDTRILNEDAYLDALDELESERGTRGGLVVDYHSSDLFPERLFDLVIVLRTRNDVLYHRLAARQYSDHKIRENIDAEILRVCLDEAVESYDESIVHELPSNTADEMDDAVDFVVDQIAAYQQRHQAAAAE